jgi:hypothetical protein
VFRRKISVDSELYEQLKECSEAEGYASPEEFAIHVLEKAVDRLRGRSAPAGEPEAEVAASGAVAGSAAESGAVEPVADERGAVANDEETLRQSPADPESTDGAPESRGTEQPSEPLQ